MKSQYTTDEEAFAALLSQIGKTQNEVEALVHAGEWHVWSAKVTRPGDGDLGWHWDFRNDFPQTVPGWLDIEMLATDTIASCIPRVRLGVDTRRCHLNSDNAITSRSAGYEHAFRVQLRDGGQLWINERVSILHLPEGSMYMLGVCTPATDDEIIDALAAIGVGGTASADCDDPCADPVDEMSTDEIRQYARRLRAEGDLLARSAQWLVWSATVHLVRSDPPTFHWVFRCNLTQTAPAWFDVERVGGEDIAVTLNGARLIEDDAACEDNARRALLSGVAGYNQTFRIRLCDHSVCWIEENVSIRPVAPGNWELVGVCVNATQRKTAEANSSTQNDELRSMQLDLQVRQEEIDELKQALRAEREALTNANQRIDELTKTDSLTGAKNYNAFRDHLLLDLAAAERYNNPVSVIVVEIDHFKALNEEFGRAVGDAVLVQVADILANDSRICDCIARYSSDQFGVIVPLTDRKGANALAERFRQAVETANWTHGPVTVSCGVATTSLDSLDADILLTRAETALASGKSAGRNTVAVG